MGLADFAKQKLIDHLQKSMNVEEDVPDSSLSETDDEEVQTPQYSDEVYLAAIASQERQAKAAAEEDRREREREREEEREEREEKKRNQKKAEEIYNAPMPEAKDIVLEIKTCEQKSDNCSLSYEERDAYESRAKLLKEYAKQKYANDPAVKAYLRKNTLQNKRFLIMWCVFLVLAIIVFILCEEWWHYVLAVIGAIAVAVVLFFVHTLSNK